MESLSHVRSIARREWNAYFDSPIAYVFLVIFLVLSGFFTFSVMRFYESEQADLRSFFIWLPWLYLILVPAVAMRLWAEERREGTIELLLTLAITPTQAILGKFIAAWLFLLLGLVLTFPVVATAAYLGSPDLGVIVCGYLAGALLAGAFLGIGLFTSALTRNQVISFVLSVVIGLFLILAGFPPVTDLLSRWAPAWLLEGVAAFSVMSHFDSMQRGVLNLQNLVYFGSVIFFALFVTCIVIKDKAAS